MASRPIVPQQARGEAAAIGGNGVKRHPQQQKNIAAGGARNRRALNDIGNLVAPGQQQQQGGTKQQLPSRPITRSFCAQLLANAQSNNNTVGVAPAHPPQGVVATKKAAPPVPKQGAAVEKKKAVAVVVTKQPKPEEIIEISPDTDEKKVEDEEEKSTSVDNQIKKGNSVRSSRKKAPTMTTLLTARSKIACGVSDKQIAPKNKQPAIVDIDAEDINNELAVVEYIEDMYKFYKEAEHECRPHDYMDTQPEINEKMRSILVDWLIEVHNRFELMPETLYLTINIIDRFLAVKMVPRKELQLVGIGSMLIACKYEEIWAPEINDFVCISDRVYTNDQILRMEKTILGNLEWTLTVPTPYVFLVRFIKASIPDDEVNNLVYYLAELALMSYSTIIYCPSMIAAASVYVARRTLNKGPGWTETLRKYTGFEEWQLIDCAKVLVNLQASVPGSKLQVVYRKYSKPERCAVAFCSPAKSILGAAVPGAVGSGSSS